VNRIADQVTRFVVRLTPKAGRDRIDGWASAADGTRLLKARVAAAPERGKANAALIALLAKALDVPASAMAIASGKTARIKHVVLRGESSRLRASLEALGEAK
jgi:uncharacterized protein YggU (UPF0235/DUF167 family)